MDSVAQGKRVSIRDIYDTYETPFKMLYVEYIRLKGRLLCQEVSAMSANDKLIAEVRQLDQELTYVREQLQRAQEKNKLLEAELKWHKDMNERLAIVLESMTKVREEIVRKAQL